MSDSNGCKENICTYGMKFVVLLCGIIGIIFSIAAAQSCDFITFVDTDGNPPDMAEDPPFNTALAGSVGIFGYTITEGAYDEASDSYGATTTIGKCIGYEDTFFGQSSYPSLATSQFCVLIAPILAGIGLFANLVDFCVCNFTGSNLIGSLFFIGASLLSAGTFCLLADPAFCLEDAELECTVGSGIYMSIGSTVFYFISCLLLFCSPQADPFCYNFGFKNKKSKTTTTKPEEGRTSRMRTIDEGGEIPPQQQQPTTVVVNIMSSNNNDDEDGNNKRRKKKNQTSRTLDDDDDDDNDNDVDTATMNSKKKKKKKKKNQTSIASEMISHLSSRFLGRDDDDSHTNSDSNSNSNTNSNHTTTTNSKKKKRKKKNQKTAATTSEDGGAGTTINELKNGEVAQ